MKMESELKLNLIIEGRVQGVGYRYFTKMKAESLCIRGSVKNMSDGTVFVTAQGEKEAIKNFVKLCFKGPPGAVVQKIQKIRGKTENLSEFSIIY